MLPRKICAMSVVLSSALLISLSGCESKEQRSVQTIQRDQSPVVAQVNDEAITQADVDFMLERMLKGQALVQADDALRRKIVDSLIASRAMKIQVESSLTTEEKQSIVRAAKAYEEELYVKQYLSDNVVPEPVTLEMVQTYYEKHPEEFGGEAVRDFQMLILNNAKDQQARDKFLTAVPEMKAVKDWAATKKQWAQVYGIQYQEVRARPGLLDAALEKIINSLAAAQVSDLVYINDQIYLVKVTRITQLAPKPLSEVSADIRKKLAAQQLRTAVKKASEDVLKKVQVKMPDANMQ